VTPGPSLGAMPGIAVVAAIGLVTVAFADNAARHDGAGAQLLFWLGLALIYGPVAFRLLGRSPRRSERIALVLTLGLALFLVKVLRSPAEFVRFDEFGWWRATHEVLVTGHAFTGNQLNVSTAGYPALATLTAAVSQLSGLSIFLSGTLVIGIARVILLLALFLLLERLTGSPRAAGVGIAIYVCNSSFLYFDAQFAYESLALGLALAVLLVSLRWSESDQRPPASLTTGVGAILLILTCGLTISHHLTSLFVVLLLALWTIASLFQSRSQHHADMVRRRNGPLVPTVLTTLLVATWLIFVAGPTTHAELGAIFTGAYQSVGDLVLGTSGSKHLFTGSGKTVSQVERAVILTAVTLVLCLVVAGLIRMWRSRPVKPLSLALGIVAILYPVSLGLRLTQASSEIATRAPAFAFLGVALLAAILTASPSRRSWGTVSRHGGKLVVTALAITTFFGGFMLGELKATRQPGPYLVGAESRSVTPPGVAAADFAAHYLPTNSNMVADRTDAALFGSYGNLNPIFGSYSRISLARILLGGEFDRADKQALCGQSIAFIVVDKRLSREAPFELPLVGFYVSSHEPGAFVRTRPVTLHALEKFNSVRGISIVYRNGPITIYDTTELC
jgi:hypothetical protein